MTATSSMPLSTNVRVAIERVLQQLQRPLVDTSGCDHRGHVMTIVERLGLVSCIVQEINYADDPGVRRGYREDLVEQLAELAANVVMMLTEEMIACEDK